MYTKTWQCNSFAKLESAWNKGTLLNSDNSLSVSLTFSYSFITLAREYDEMSLIFVKQG